MYEGTVDTQRAHTQCVTLVELLDVLRFHKTVGQILFCHVVTSPSHVQYCRFATNAAASFADEMTGCNKISQMPLSVIHYFRVKNVLYASHVLQTYNVWTGLVRTYCAVFSPESIIVCSVETGSEVNTLMRK